MDPEPGEQILFVGHPSWGAFVALYAKGVALAVVIGAAVGFISGVASGTVQTIWVLAAVLVVFMVVFGVGLLAQLRTTYTITSRRLTIDTGLLSSDLHETRLERIQNVNSRQTLLQRMLDIGTVDFDTAAGAEYEFSFRGVSQPRQVVRTVSRALHELQRAHPGV